MSLLFCCFVVCLFVHFCISVTIASPVISASIGCENGTCNTSDLALANPVTITLSHFKSLVNGPSPSPPPSFKLDHIVTDPCSLTTHLFCVCPMFAG